MVKIEVSKSQHMKEWMMSSFANQSCEKVVADAAKLLEVSFKLGWIVSYLGRGVPRVGFQGFRNPPSRVSNFANQVYFSDKWSFSNVIKKPATSSGKRQYVCDWEQVTDYKPVGDSL